MSQLQEVEAANTMRVAAALRDTVPDRSFYEVEIACHLATENHAGIAIGSAKEGFSVFYRCRMKWWEKHMSVYGNQPPFTPADFTGWVGKHATADKLGSALKGAVPTAIMLAKKGVGFRRLGAS